MKKPEKENSAFFSATATADLMYLLSDFEESHGFAHGGGEGGLLAGDDSGFACGLGFNTRAFLPC